MDQDANTSPFSYLDLDTENSGDDIIVIEIDTGSDVDEDLNAIDDENNTSDSEGSGDYHSDDEDLVIFEFKDIKPDIFASTAA